MKNPLPRQARSEPFSATMRQSLRRWTASVRPYHMAAPQPTAGLAARTRLSTNVACDYFAGRAAAMSPSPFRALLYEPRRSSAAQAAAHDRFGSRRNTLRHAGAWPRHGAGGG